MKLKELEAIHRELTKDAYSLASYERSIVYDPECVMDVRSALHSQTTNPDDDLLISKLDDNTLMEMFFALVEH